MPAPEREEPERPRAASKASKNVAAPMINLALTCQREIGSRSMRAEISPAAADQCSAAVPAAPDDGRASKPVPAAKAIHFTPCPRIYPRFSAINPVAMEVNHFVYKLASPVGSHYSVRQLTIRDRVYGETACGRGFSAYVQGPARAEHDRIVDEAEAPGVFGVPTMVFHGELFWGGDRVDMLIGRGPGHPGVVDARRGPLKF